MKRIIFLLISSVFLTACSAGNNNIVSLVEEEEDEAVTEGDLKNIDYNFDYEAADEEFSNLKIWIDQYVDGEKEDTVLSLIHNMAGVEESEGQLSFNLNNIVPEHSDGETVGFNLGIDKNDDTVDSSLTDTDVTVDSGYSIAYGPVLSEDEYTLTDDEEVVAAMVALNDDSRMPAFNLEPDMPSNIDFDEHIREVAGDVDVLYIMKIQFTDEM